MHPHAKMFKEMDIHLSAEDAFFLLRLLTVERLHLEDKYTGTLPFVRANFSVDEEFPLGEDKLEQFIERCNRARADGLAEIVALKNIENHFWEKINNGS